MYRSYTKIFKIFGAVIIFLQISKVAALFIIQKISNPTVLSLTDDPAPHDSDPKQSARRRYRLRLAKRTDDETPAKQTVPS